MSVESKTETEAEIMNGLLQEELSVIEHYRAVDEALRDKLGVSELVRFSAEHRLAADALRGYIESVGGVMPRVVKAPEERHHELDVAALYRDEEHAARAYRNALSRAALSDSAKRLIQATLLPRVEARLETLIGLIVAGPARGAA